jgi:hypothetical protein
MTPSDRGSAGLSNGRPSPLFERRVDPGVNALRPKRVDPPSKLPTKIAPTPDLTGMPARLPVKR